MKLERRIYCIEGHWDDGDGNVEPSVEPMLQQMRNMDLWPYARRDCATVQELQFFLDKEWYRRCREGSILYLATHGWNGGISLSEGQDVTLEQLALFLGADGAQGCLVHFSGCRVMNAEERRLQDFMASTNAAAITGYKREAGWTSTLVPGGRGAPALALELLLFSSIRTQAIDLGDGRSFGRLRSLVADLHERFPDCGLDLLPRPPNDAELAGKDLEPGVLDGVLDAAPVDRRGIEIHGDKTVVEPGGRGCDANAARQRVLHTRDAPFALHSFDRKFQPFHGSFLPRSSATAHSGRFYCAARQRRSNSELPTTLTLDSAIAAAARVGLR